MKKFGIIFPPSIFGENTFEAEHGKLNSARVQLTLVAKYSKARCTVPGAHAQSIFVTVPSFSGSDEKLTCRVHLPIAAPCCTRNHQHNGGCQRFTRPRIDVKGDIVQTLVGVKVVLCAVVSCECCTCSPFIQLIHCRCRPELQLAGRHFCNKTLGWSGELRLWKQ